MKESASEQKNVIITGFMGTGKTTVGKIVAHRLSRPFWDTDEIIVRRTGKTIADIFRTDGEDHFRKVEREVLHDLTQKSGLVVATGGGTLIDPADAEKAMLTGVVFCLDTRLEVLKRRLDWQTGRPLLAGSDGFGKLQTLLESRQERYRQLPNHLDTSESDPENIAAKIIERYAEQTVVKRT